MPSESITKPLVIRNGRANLRISLLPSGADLIERAAGQEGKPATTWARDVLLRVARRVVGS